MFIIKNKKIFIAISAGLVLLSVIFLSVFGLKAGIDFKGGALTEVAYQTSRPAQADLSSAISAGLVLLSVIFLSVFGLKAGIDFKGGALTEVAYQTSRPAQADLSSAI